MSLPKEVEDYVKNLETEIEEQKIKNIDLEKENRTYTSFDNTEQKNLVEWQLDLHEELDKIKHFLKGDVVEIDEKGNEYWASPKDKVRITLTDHGVDLFMNIVSFLINKNLILSNFDIEEIRWKMRDFGNELADAILLDYENIFYKPSVEDLIERDLKEIKELEEKKKKYKPGIENTIENQLKKRFINLLDKKITEIKDKSISDYMEESDKIYAGNKKKYPLLCDLIIQSIHATYNRALNGGERTSLRKTMHVAQNDPMGNNNRLQFPQKSIWRPSTWGR